METAVASTWTLPDFPAFAAFAGFGTQQEPQARVSWSWRFAAPEAE